MAAFGGQIAENANRETEAHFGKDRSDVRLNAAVRDTLRRLFPVKTAANASALTGLTKRRCEQLLSEHTGISAPVLSELIQSDVGFEFLTAVMGDSAPAWWGDFKTKVQDAQIDAAIAELQRQRRAVRQGVRKRR